MQTTSASLLMKLKRADQPAAWSRFVRVYSPLLYSWSVRMGLQDADALDLVQDVFTTLVQKLPEFSYDGDRGFRNWLWRVTRNKFLERARRRNLPVLPGDLPDDLAGHDEPSDAPVEEADFRDHLLRRVVPTMSAQFQPTTWKAFWEHVVEDRSAPEVAAELGISPEAVYKAKVRVLSRLHRELADLADD
jgi:RNA polymerase sigma-70 factor, ECF subfamily